MRILLVNKFFFPYGGSETAFFQTAEMMEREGHEVVFFSMAHPRNLPCRDSAYFAARVDFEEMTGFFDRAGGLARILFGAGVRSKLERLLLDRRPDVAHLHNIYHHLSPVVISVLKRHHIPTVMTLHDYKPVCPAFKLFRRGEICHRCRGRKYHWCFLQRCVKKSAAKSFVSALELLLHYRLYEQIDAFIAPSRFMQAKMEEMGFRGRFFHIPNFTTIGSTGPPAPVGPPRILYFGRLVEEKGVEVLIRAMGDVDAQCLIVGDGPLRESLQRLAARTAKERISFLSHQPRSSLAEIIRQSSLVVVPSVWYENNPFSILESFAQQVPVIASRIGGIPELVIEGETGLTFTPGDSSDLSRQIRSILSRPDRLRAMGASGRLWMERHNNSSSHFQSLMSAYEAVLAAHGTGVES